SYFESDKYQSYASTDGGVDPTTYEVGTNLTLTPFLHGLVGYWPLSSINGSGINATSTDLSGWNSYGTIEDATTTESVYGPTTTSTNCMSNRSTCLHFDEIGDSVGTNNNYGGLTSFSVSLWVNTSDSQSEATFWEAPTMFGKGSSGPSSGDFGIMSSGGYAGFWTGLHSGGDDYLTSSVKINDSIWHNVTVVNNGTSATMYIDSVSAGSLLTGLGLDNLEPFSIGARYDEGESACYYDATQCFYGGIISGVRFYKTVLTQGQVQAIYNSEKP
ncbi:MAG: LamG domain-containing protein, partial [Patescibacteria group bacterium]|nr:LamG domain-containing protein [Patescibacteria group bacterium]